MHKEITYNPLQKLSAEHIDKDCNVVILAPTSSGKTIVAEQFLFSAIEKGLKGIYLSPLKALTEEKKRAWSGKYPMTIVTSDYGAVTFQNPLILMTTEALDSKTRGGPLWLQKVGCVAVDEAHLLGSSGRGDALEIGLIRFTEINPEARIVLLSATIPNAKAMAEWLTRLNGKPTETVETDWRPVDQEHHLIKSGNKPWHTIKDTYKLVNQLSRQMPDKQMLIFVHAIGRGHTFARELGCPFHYSKLSREKKASIEDAFSKGQIKRLVCTSTLAYGVNLPADIAIISGATRGPTTVDPIDIKQEAGRAGRYGLSERGYAYYIFESYLADELFEQCINVPDVHSVLDERLYFHIVSLIHREGKQREEIKTFLAKSFENNFDADLHIEKLQQEEILLPGDELIVTAYGRAAALMYLDPLDLVALSRNLDSCPTDVDSIAMAFAEVPSRALPGYIPDDIAAMAVECKYEQQTIVATCLAEWMKGHDLKGSFAVITPSLVRDIGRWVSGLSITGKNIDYIKSVGIMLSNGIPKHLIELVSQKGVGRKKAMKLYSFGITDLVELHKNPVEGRALIGKKLYDEITGHMEGRITLKF